LPLNFLPPLPLGGRGREFARNNKNKKNKFIEEKG